MNSVPECLLIPPRRYKKDEYYPTNGAGWSGYLSTKYHEDLCSKEISNKKTDNPQQDDVQPVKKFDPLDNGIVFPDDPRGNVCQEVGGVVRGCVTFYTLKKQAETNEDSWLKDRRRNDIRFTVPTNAKADAPLVLLQHGARLYHLDFVCVPNHKHLQALYDTWIKPPCSIGTVWRSTSGPTSSALKTASKLLSRSKEPIPHHPFYYWGAVSWTEAPKIGVRHHLNVAATRIIDWIFPTSLTPLFAPDDDYSQASHHALLKHGFNYKLQKKLVRSMCHPKMSFDNLVTNLHDHQHKAISASLGREMHRRGDSDFASRQGPPSETRLLGSLLLQLFAQHAYRRSGWCWDRYVKRRLMRLQVVLSEENRLRLIQDLHRRYESAHGDLTEIARAVHASDSIADLHDIERRIEKLRPPTFLFNDFCNEETEPAPSLLDMIKKQNGDRSESEDDDDEDSDAEVEESDERSEEEEEEEEEEELKEEMENAEEAESLPKFRRRLLDRLLTLRKQLDLSSEFLNFLHQDISSWTLFDFISLFGQANIFGNNEKAMVVKNLAGLRLMAEGRTAEKEWPHAADYHAKRFVWYCIDRAKDCVKNAFPAVAVSAVHTLPTCDRMESDYQVGRGRRALPYNQTVYLFKINYATGERYYAT